MTILDEPINVTEAAAKIVLVTPETAERWLARNTSNRKIRAAHVATLASDMVAGNFQLTGEAVKFDRDGNLIDGQHRLSAIVKSGVTLQLLVVTGLLPQSQQVMDSGAKRTAADALGFAGFGRQTILAHAARIGIGMERGTYKVATTQPPSVTHSEVIQFVELNPDLANCVELTNGYRTVGRSQGMAAIAMLHFRQLDPILACSFVRDLIERRSSGDGDPRSALVRRFAVADRAREQFVGVTELYLLFRTWNAVRMGEQLKVLKYTERTAFARPR